jgi:hypothetical protein
MLASTRTATYSALPRPHEDEVHKKAVVVALANGGCHLQLLVQGRRLLHHLRLLVVSPTLTPSWRSDCNVVLEDGAARIGEDSMSKAMCHTTTSSGFPDDLISSANVQKLP